MTSSTAQSIASKGASLLLVTGTATPAIHARYNEVFEQFAFASPLVDHLAELAPVIAQFREDAYPAELLTALSSVESDRHNRILSAARSLYDNFGRTLPAALYELILLGIDSDHIGLRGRDDGTLSMPCQRLYDSALHALLETTPLNNHVQQVLSEHGLTLGHMHNCSCITPDTDYMLPTSYCLTGEQRHDILELYVQAWLDQYMFFPLRAEL